MNEATTRALAAINRRFYAEHAQAFSDTRGAPWPGWRRLLPALRARAARGPLRVLDIGCGNGRFAHFLAAELPDAALAYCGIDSSGPLLEIARAAAPAGAEWRLADAPGALPSGPFDLVAMFALLHGVPGRARRAALLDACAARVAPGGLLAFTTWHLEHGRCVDWADVAEPIDPAELEPGDALLPWGDGDTVVRYVHHFDDDEIADGYARTKLRPELRYRADGRDGASNEYFVFRAP